MDKRYIKFFDGYRAAYGLADFEHKEAVVDPESGKKKPVYRWNYEPLTEEVYQSHLEGKISIGIQPCNEHKEARMGIIDVDPKDYIKFEKKIFIDRIQEFDLPLIPIAHSKRYQARSTNVQGKILNAFGGINFTKVTKK